MEQLDLFDSFQSNFVEAERLYLEAQQKYHAAKKLRDDNCEHVHTSQKLKIDELCCTALFQGYDLETYCVTCGTVIGSVKKYAWHD